MPRRDQAVVIWRVTGHWAHDGYVAGYGYPPLRRQRKYSTKAVAVKVAKGWLEGRKEASWAYMGGTAPASKVDVEKCVLEPVQTMSFTKSEDVNETLYG